MGSTRWDARSSWAVPPRVRVARSRRCFTSASSIFSRFTHDSELNRVNAGAGRFVLVSPLFAETLRVALQAAEETQGLVEPTLGAALVAAGYTRDPATLVPDPRPVGPVDGARPVFALGRVVGVPPGVQLDLNGVVKALAVDDALALLDGRRVRVRGWRHGDPRTAHGRRYREEGPSRCTGARSPRAASTKRRWMRGGELQHHLLDARTGRPASSPWTSVTACGATCLAADVAAKAGFLAGDLGPSWLDARGIPARFVEGRR